MSLTFRTQFGCTEAIIEDDGGLRRFYQVSNILSDELDVNFIKKEDDFDTLSWTFMYKSHALTLYYNIYTGISIYPSRFRKSGKKENEAVKEVAGCLKNKLSSNIPAAIVF